MTALKWHVRPRKMTRTKATTITSNTKNTKGFTLIELTVVLAVIVTLALVLTPSIINFITDSRVARARNDTQTISAAIIQFYRDNAFFPQWSLASAGGPGTAANKVDLLVSSGNVPTIAAPSTWTTGTTDLLDDQLLSNAPGYTARTGTNAFGWNGPYLSSGIGADSWNNRYMVNIGLIDATQGTQTGAGAIKGAVWVISAGANGQIETTHTQPMTTAVLGGDDIGIRIQ
jgi:prepilin-type N-terminal cleavage/methylation domain-containing protein